VGRTSIDLARSSDWSRRSVIIARARVVEEIDAAGTATMTTIGQSRKIGASRIVRPQRESLRSRTDWTTSFVLLAFATREVIGEDGSNAPEDQR
jgi:hypothetical protein